MASLTDSETYVESRGCILVVDDEPAIRMMLQDFLESMNYFVIEAGDGQQAIDRFNGAEVDLVVTDINMPTKSGIELLHELQALDAALPVIMITGQPSVEAAVECIRTGAVDFITKPFDLAEITRRIETALENRRSQQADELQGTMMRQFSERDATPAGYRVERMLGQGSMGVVYLVRREPDDGQLYAMKVLRGETLAGHQRRFTLERFRREAKSAEMVNHPGVVKIYDYGTDEKSGTPYIVMEYLQGKSLKFLITRGELSLLQKLSIVAQVADALAAIHAAGICHRDVKPANIMVDAELRTKITDFGIARMPDSHLTMTSSFVGSPAYMAPEAFITAKVDSRADIFSLGVIAYELLAGKKPFGGDNLPQMMHAIHHTVSINPHDIDPDIPGELADTIMLMLEKDPALRLQEMSQVATIMHDIDNQLGFDSTAYE